jgi:ribosome-associated protein
MSNEHIDKNVNEIFNNKEFNFPLNSAMAAAWILGNLKGINLKIYDVRKISSLGDYYVMGSATNIRQAHAMAEMIGAQLKKHNMKIISTEGKADSDWILLDLGDILVHIFLEVSRGNYNLESLWDEAIPVEIPSSYYFSGDDTESNDDEKNYF